MKKSLLFILALLLVFPLTACNVSSDSSYHKDGKTDLVLSDITNTSPLKVAASKQPLVLPENFFPYSGFRGRDFAEAHDTLYCRAIVLQSESSTVAILSYEIGDVGGNTLDKWMEQIELETGIPQENIFFHAEHVHSAPYAGSDCEEVVTDIEKTEQFKEICFDAALAAISECLENLEPATLNIGTSQCYINVNRDYKYQGDINSDGIKSAYITWMNPDGYSDHTVTVLRFNSLVDGHTIALWSNYAVHSEVMFHVFQYTDNKMILCSDIAGHTSMYVEDAYKSIGENVVCMYTMGAAGDQMPQAIGVYYTFDALGNATEHQMTADGALSVMQAQANSLAEAILKVCRNMNSSGNISEVSLVAAQKLLSIPGKIKDENRGDYHGPTSIPTSNGWEYDFNADPVDLEIGLIRLGNFAIATVGAEISAEIGTDIQASLIDRGFVGAIVVTVCNGQHSYLTTRDGYEAFTFEATASLMAPGGDMLLVDGISTLAQQIQG